jgi:uncharacterized protein YjbI with pentapeptide repeats
LSIYERSPAQEEETMTACELLAAYAAGKRDFSGAILIGADLRNADLYSADLSDADLTGANLYGAKLGFANLSDADLSGADLFHADLRGAYLSAADLRDATLTGADLRGADLRGADLSDADLRGANLGGADLRGADLRGANLYSADLSCADLGGANLSRANLRAAEVRGAKLRDTCLAPGAGCLAPPSDAQIEEAGLELRGSLVYGWRTKTSQHCGSTTYETGNCYEAPVFSVDHDTPCHPGIYLAGKAWLKDKYPDEELVRCRCNRLDLVKAGDKWRTRKLWVVEDNNVDNQ